MLTSKTNDGFSSTDQFIEKISMALFFLSFIILPYILITNIFSIRERLPLFKRNTALGFLLGSIISSFLILVLFGTGESIISNYYSPQYKAVQETKRLAQLAKDKVDAENKAQSQAQLAKDKADAEKNAQVQAQLAKDKADAEKKTQAQAQLALDKADADAKAKKDAEDKVKAEEAQKSANGNSNTNLIDKVKDSLSDNSGNNNLVDNTKDQISNVVDSNNKYVQGVKNAIPKQYPNTTYGDAFKDFFGSPTWKYFNATNGDAVVEFTGFCNYQNVEVKARLQFIMSKDGNTFTIGALDFNSVPQNELIKQSLLVNIFKQSK